MKFLKSIIMAMVMATICTSVFGQANTDTLKTTIINVSGISCNGDLPLIKKKLINKDGIDAVSFSEAKNGVVTFTVKFHSIATSEKQIRLWIEAAPSCDNPNEYPYKAIPIILTPKKQ